MKKIILRTLVVGIVLSLTAGCTLFRSKTSVKKSMNLNASDVQQEAPTNMNVNVTSDASASTEIDATVSELAADGDAEAAAFTEESGDADLVTSDADMFSGFDQSVQSDDF